MKNVYQSGERSANLTLKPYLRDGETLLWTRTPYEKTSYRPPLLPIVFMIFWFGFAVFWTVSASVMGGLFGLFGIPFLLAGGAMLWFLTAGVAGRYRHTLYAVTDRRAIILADTRRGTSYTEYTFSRLSGVALRNAKDGSGTIELVSPEAMYLRNINYRGGRRTYLSGDSFVMIADVERVYRMISERIGDGNGGQKPTV